MSRLLATERRTRRRTRALTCCYQALLVLVWFRRTRTSPYSEPGSGVSRATAYRDVAEGIEALAAIPDWPRTTGPATRCRAPNAYPANAASRCSPAVGASRAVRGAVGLRSVGVGVARLFGDDSRIRVKLPDGVDDECLDAQVCLGEQHIVFLLRDTQCRQSITISRELRKERAAQRLRELVDYRDSSVGRRGLRHCREAQLFIVAATIAGKGRQ
ncbi:hypothetical protein [Dactylosporangium sp. NPDC051484]|uniref:hypothetical protein n=1 Tax=Dactylosporangium sp. NPDC051484 TaxID=3154942 RepID=UPI0034509F81